MKIPKFIFLLFSVIIVVAGKAQEVRPSFLDRNTPWADSVFATLSLDQKIGQLFMVAAWSNKDSKHTRDIDSLIVKYNIGGLIFFQGGPLRQAKLTNKYQAESDIPLLIAMDAEWGLGMRLDSTISYPRQLTLGAIQDEKIIYDFGKEMARQLSRLGVHVSFSPVVDINSNPKNPVISNRSFGEDIDLVTTRSLGYMHGLQDGGVMAVAKHFPGHGDTDSDSHKDLPVLNHTVERMDSIELAPYRSLIEQGLSSVMVAHLYIPSLDNTPNVASTLSPKIINDLLKKKLGFEGLVYTDALNMQGVTKYWAPGEVDIRALVAGNDVLLFSTDVPLAIKSVKEAVAKGIISEEEINVSCLKILRAKEWSGLAKYQPIDLAFLHQDLNNGQAQTLRRRMIEQSITVIKNGCDLLPVTSTYGKRIAVVTVGAPGETAFVKTLRAYADFDVFPMDKNPGLDAGIKLHDTLSTYDLVIAAFLGTSNKPSKNFGVSNEATRILNSVGISSNMILAVFANPYALEGMKDLSNTDGLIISYQDDEMTQMVVAEVIMGACPADGSLPVTACNDYACFSGINLANQIRMRWVHPEYVGLHGFTDRIDHDVETITGSAAGDEENYKEDMMADGVVNSSQLVAYDFYAIDSIAQSGITRGAYPGCRVLAAKDGLVFYDKSFGNIDWIGKKKVTENTVYDLASITKIVSSMLAVMKLQEEGKVDVNATLGQYLDIPAGNPYSKVVISEMLSHTAGFTAWIPFYSKTLKDGKPDPTIYRTKAEEGFTSQVAQDLYIIDSYRDSIYQQILSTPISSEKKYKYSDLGYYFIQRIVESKTGTSLDSYVTEHFYQPMGLTTMGYNPLNRIPADQIAPTENDQTFRKQTVRGYVHDQGAAMMGGVAGHAGVFSNARDLGALMQMLLDSGQYAGHQFLKPATIKTFNTCYYPNNRRGLGFDKPALSLNGGSTSNEASWSSFGHTGFTGTMCWVDPETGIVFVFLSNRVNPDAENKKIQDLNIRTEIQSALYRAFGFKNRRQK
jgi:beta-N-acetylhexosaminidase